MLQGTTNEQFETIIYDRVDVNIGNAYNRNTGTVTAPYTGTYLLYQGAGKDVHFIQR